MAWIRRNITSKLRESWKRSVYGGNLNAVISSKNGVMGLMVEISQ